MRGVRGNGGSLVELGGMEWLGKGWNMFSRGEGRERDGGRDGKGSGRGRIEVQRGTGAKGGEKEAREGGDREVRRKRGRMRV